jgi:hypothetical protein
MRWVAIPGLNNVKLFKKMERFDQLAVECFNGHRITEWFAYKTHKSIDGGNVYNQKKNILREICESLPNMLPVDPDDTKDVLVTRLKRYVFTAEQLDELRKLRDLKKRLNEHESRRRRIKETVVDCPRPHSQLDQLRLDWFSRDEAKLYEECRHFGLKIN